MEEFIGKLSDKTICLLFGISKYGLMSRTFMLKEHSQTLEKIWLNSDEYKSYSIEHRQFVEARTYVELIERTCQLIEDFCCYSYSLWDNIESFPQRIIKQPSIQSILKEFDSSKWDNLLRYADVNSLSLLSDEKELVHDIRKRNNEVLNKYLKVLESFLKLYWVFYTKHKHGNPLIYGFKAFEIEGEPTIFIPAAYNSKNVSEMTGIIMNRTMYKKLQIFFNELYQLTADILDTTIKYIQREGKPFIVYHTYCKIYDDHVEKIHRIIKKYDSSTQFHNVDLTIKVDMQQETVKKHLDFYNNMDLGAFDSY